MRLTPAKLALVYVTLSGLWVVVSSELVFLELKTPAAVTRWEVCKGLAFIFVSGLFIYWISHRLLRRLLKSEHSLREAEAQAQALYEQLMQAQKLEAFGQMAGAVTHDSNNFLQVITSNAYLLEKETTTPAAQSRLSAIIGAAQRAATLTRQLLDFGRRQVVVETKPVNLSNIVQHTEALLERLLGPKTTLQLNLEPDLWNVIADPEQMTQVLMNLCLNARDALPQGGTVEIETRNVADGGGLSSTQAKKAAGPAVLLTVRDNGEGMSAAVREKIFEPFFTTKEPGKGTGLGLSIVSGIVKQRGGFIDVRSRQGKGTAFHIYIPRDSQHGASNGEIQHPK